MLIINTLHTFNSLPLIWEANDLLSLTKHKQLISRSMTVTAGIQRPTQISFWAQFQSVPGSLWTESSCNHQGKKRDMTPSMSRVSSLFPPEAESFWFPCEPSPCPCWRPFSASSSLLCCRRMWVFMFTEKKRDRILESIQKEQWMVLPVHINTKCKRHSGFATTVIQRQCSNSYHIFWTDTGCSKDIMQPPNY